MTSVQVRPASVEDISAIRAVADQTWRKAYGEIFDTDFIDAFLADAYSAANLQRAIEHAPSCFFVAQVAIDARPAVVGYVHAAPLPDGGDAQLFRIYLLPDHWGKGIGSRLLETVETCLRARDMAAYYCFVHKQNAVGIDFYLRKGFEHTPEDDRDDEWYMRKSLLHGPAGA
jgi:ribosomal protein S18 acetylase RimI-like enzyme